MALQGLFSSLLVTITPLPCTTSLPSARNNLTICSDSKPVQCMTPQASAIGNDRGAALRRTANYAPSFWDYNFIKSLTSDYINEENYARQIEELKDDVRRLIQAETGVSLVKLELLDSVHRLGLNYKFQEDVKQAVDVIYKNSSDAWLNDDLYSVALRFRILREHGYAVPQDVFRRFKDDTGYFKANLCQDVKGLLSLYEASFFGFKDEDIIDEAKAFSTAHLKKSLKGEISPSMARKVKCALDMPLRWKLPRVEARWYINTYEKEHNMNPNLLKLAKLDYNILQSVYQKEVSKLASWWVEIGLNKMEFARDRLLEHYFWCNGMVSGPEYSAYREMGTKIICVIITIDDVYDVYGSLEELELFTDYVDRWDITEIDKLPMNIRTVLLAMFNTTNEIGYWTIRERGFNIIPYLRKQLAKLLKSFLKEAKWYHSDYKPTLEEYLENGAISGVGQLVLFCAYFLTAEKITVNALEYIDKFPSIVWCPSLILRLTNDLGTYSDELARGDTLKAVQCYMNDTGASEEVSKNYVDGLVHEAWKTLNKELLGSFPFREPFLSANPNLARTTQTVYQYGDGLGIPQNGTMDHLKSLLIEPFKL